MKIRIGDKLVEADASGKIKVTTEEVPNKSGGIDVVVHIPCLTIQAKKVEA
jgi:hypothetical protein